MLLLCASLKWHLYTLGNSCCRKCRTQVLLWTTDIKWRVSFPSTRLHPRDYILVSSTNESMHPTSLRWEMCHEEMHTDPFILPHRFLPVESAIAELEMGLSTGFWLRRSVTANMNSNWAILTGRRTFTQDQVFGVFKGELVVAIGQIFTCLKQLPQRNVPNSVL